ncbi:MAG: sulfatase [Myxococcota bacterium]
MILSAAAAGAALYGFADAARTLSRDTLTASPTQQLLLSLSDAAVTALLVLPLTVPLLFVSRRSGWVAFFWGLLAAVLFDLGVWTAQTGAPPVQSIAAGGGLLLIAVGLSRFATTSRQRVAVVIGITFALTSRGLFVRRDLAPRGTPPVQALDVLLITVDSLRFDALGPDTPNLLRVQQDSAAFVETYVPASDTLAAHRALFTGRLPWAPPAQRLARVLRAQGWRTGAFVSAHELVGEFVEGFEIYDDDFRWVQGWADTFPGRLMLTSDPDARLGGRTVDAALTWMAKNQPRGAPLLTWVHLHDPTAPYAPPPPWDTRFVQGDPRDPAHTSMQAVDDPPVWLEGITDVDWPRAQYRGEVAYVDEQVGRLIDFVDQTGRLDRTVVVIVGAHGESLGEQHQWFSHQGALHGAVTHVPLMIRLPSGVPMGARVEWPVALTDIAPTILDLLRLPAPESIDGFPLSEAFVGGAPPRERLVAVDGEVLALRKPGVFLYRYDAAVDAGVFFDVSSGKEIETELPQQLSGLPDSARQIWASINAGR